MPAAEKRTALAREYRQDCGGCSRIFPASVRFSTPSFITEYRLQSFSFQRVIPISLHSGIALHPEMSVRKRFPEHVNVLDLMTSPAIRL
ncbi:MULTISPECIES: hypothetical protein [unclassified Akkermansia]|jgi:hypothetical protein|uniref:hypothetical protein n=1 Tax=unclassified Akkermansia TaxID=2608915 RepID=UPI00122F0C30|nr:MULTISPECIES: hypothetical protein [unclassified Akkermansia]KAA3161448.1 hypothetical protein F2A01_13365 [Akkermansia sp. BIOML-A60]KAA3169201.1 hypothetical protein F2A07_12760 [Akkermansia sp. BIOML-A61]KAA3175853.1 hypothetical protein F1989_11475 [Akkermansia sp. BIOML-A53]KAA3189709.1 hypothetical protein F1991_03745 [Akkermansia sp. BIOML-A52]KAA3199239.1 hypothetical protein F1984_09020 [Akkermansia sp. BIOML-A46]KAA3215699.1 hypothetical protein F1982_02450 [Akkermansia sp. BIOML